MFACLRKMDAGAMGLIGPSRQDFTACAFRASVDRSSRQLCGDFANSFRNISFAIKKVVLGDCRFMNQTFEKVFAKAGRKRSRQPNVFVEVKHFDARPLDAGHRRQGIQKFEL